MSIGARAHTTAEPGVWEGIVRGEALLRARVPVFAWLLSGLSGQRTPLVLLLAWLAANSAQTCTSHKRNSTQIHPDTHLREASLTILPVVAKV